MDYTNIVSLETKEYIVKKKTDLTAAAGIVPIGSKVLCVEDSNTYILFGKNEWVLEPTAVIDIDAKIAAAIQNINSFETAVVEALPQEGQPNTFYFVTSGNSETNQSYDEYLYLNDNWEKIGSGGGAAITPEQPDWEETDTTSLSYIKNKPFGDFTKLNLDEPQFDALKISVPGYELTLAENLNLSVENDKLSVYCYMVGSSDPSYPYTDGEKINFLNNVLLTHTDSLSVGPTTYTDCFISPAFSFRGPSMYIIYKDNKLFFATYSIQASDSAHLINSYISGYHIIIGENIKKISFEFLEGDNNKTYITAGSINDIIGVRATAEGINRLSLGNASHSEGNGIIPSATNFVSSKSNEQYKLQIESASTNNELKKSYLNELLRKFGQGMTVTVYSAINNSSTRWYDRGDVIISDSNFSYNYKTEIITFEKSFPSTYSNISTIILEFKTGSIGLNSHSENCGTTAIGENSHAEGIGTIASGIGSHAEGNFTMAIGNYSHAEGGASGSGTEHSLYASSGSYNAPIAAGISSHAEGYNTLASGNYSHAEGNSAIASGKYSHAEGSSTASGDSSHAEHGSTASGMLSHAEGITIAGRGYQHTFGTYNIEDTGDQTTKGTYIEIVGNGTSSDSRSNARTLDWSGNQWLAGQLEADAIVLRSSTPGSINKFVLTVDDSGTLKITELESIV